MIFYMIIKALAWLPAKIIFPVKVFNKKALPKEKRMIVVANHLSWKDTVLVTINIPGYRHFLGKTELKKNPLVRFFAFLLGVIFIDRNRADMNAMRKGINALKKNHGLLIYPEGTRNKVNDNIQEIKNGVVMFAAKGDAQIVPVMIDHKAKAFRKNYLYVGEPFKIDTSSSSLLTSAVMAAGADMVVEQMKKTQAELKACVAEYLARKNKKSITAAQPELPQDNAAAQSADNASESVNEDNNG